VACDRHPGCGRIGVNAGSLDKRLMAKYGKAAPGGAGGIGAVGVLAVCIALARGTPGTTR
jgi:4-hydroxy-3-methylbut-2-en-1-yl diphosphate synthase IspG/GcpE